MNTKNKILCSVLVVTAAVPAVGFAAYKTIPAARDYMIGKYELAIDWAKNTGVYKFFTCYRADRIALQTDLDTTSAEVQRLRYALTAAMEDKTVLTARVASVNVAIVEKDTEINTLQMQLDTANARVVNIQTALNGANADKTALQTALNGANADKTTLQTALNSANADKAALQADLGAASNDLVIANATITDLNDDYAVTLARIAYLEWQVSDDIVTINALNADKMALQTELDTVNATNSAEIARLQTIINNYLETMAGYETTIDSKNVLIVGYIAEIDRLNARIAELELLATADSTQLIAELQAQVASDSVALADLQNQNNALMQQMDAQQQQYAEQIRMLDISYMQQIEWLNQQIAELQTQLAAYQNA